MLAALGLWFRNSHLEREYAAHTTLNEFKTIDVRFAYFHIPMVIATTWGQWRRSRSALSTVLALALCFQVYLQWWVVCVRRPRLGRQWVKTRNDLVIVYRSVGCSLIMVVCYPLWFMEPTTDVDALTRFVTTGCGVLILVVMAFCMPLLLKSHIPAQALAVFIVSLGLIPRECTTAVTGAYGATQFVNLWEYLNGLSWAILNRVFMTSVVEDTPVPPVVACKHTTTWWLFLMAFVLPTCILAAVEHRSRRRFLATKTREEKAQELGWLWKAISFRQVWCYGVLCAVLLAISWQFLTSIYLEPSVRSFVVAMGCSRGGPT